MNARSMFRGIARPVLIMSAKRLSDTSTRRRLPLNFAPRMCGRYLSSASAESAAGVTTVPTGERLAKMIARTGICGRREAEKRIKEHRVTINGKIVTDISQRMLPADEVWLDEHKIEWNRKYEKLRLWAVHKPKEVFVAQEDRVKNRKLLIDQLVDLVRDVGEIKPVAHLDYNTEGLVLYTNNGRFARLLGSQSTGLMRVFRAKVHGLITESKLEGLKRGLVLSGVKYSSMSCHVDRKLATNTWMTVKCKDSKARQLPTCFQALHLKPTKIICTEFGPYKLGSVPVGGYMEVPVTPKLERLYYGHTRKDGGVPTQKKVKRPQTSDGNQSLPLQTNGRQDAVTSMSDNELDKLFIDNSPGARRANSVAYDNPERRQTDEQRFDRPIQESSNAAALKKLKTHLRLKKNSGVVAVDSQ